MSRLRISAPSGPDTGPQPHSGLVRCFASTRIDAALAAQISAALESNHIIYFPRCPVPLPDEATLQYLRTQLPTQLRRKNISFYPRQRRLSGLNARLDPRLYEQTMQVLQQHLGAVQTFLLQALPRLCNGRMPGKCSLRPIQERGRNLPPHASNERVHIDAGACGATDGDRILRFFVNINPQEDRVWASKGTILRLLERHGRAAGLLDAGGRLKMRLEKNAADRLRSLAVRGLGRLNELAGALDSSPYDRAMRRLHNYMKDSAQYSSDLDGYEEIRFPPGSAWMVFTDGLTHASLSGQFALVTTVLVPRSALQYPQFAPYHVLAAYAAGARRGPLTTDG